MDGSGPTTPRITSQQGVGHVGWVRDGAASRVHLFPGTQSHYDLYNQKTEPAVVHYTLCVVAASVALLLLIRLPSVHEVLPHDVGGTDCLEAALLPPDMSNSFTGLFIYLFRSQGGIYCHPCLLHNMSFLSGGEGDPPKEGEISRSGRSSSRRGRYSSFWCCSFAATLPPLSLLVCYYSEAGAISCSSCLK